MDRIELGNDELHAVVLDEGRVVHSVEEPPGPGVDNLEHAESADLSGVLVSSVQMQKIS
jgi:hypothetical protein